jgi:hypothetical protein
MMRSRFFHSSLKEIELNIKEIYLLQSELRKRVLASLNKPARMTPVQPSSLEGLGTYESSSASSDSSTKKVTADFTNVEMTSHSAEPPKEQFILNEEKFKKNNTRQTSTSSLENDSKFKTKLNEINKGINSPEETSKEHKKINRIMTALIIFIIWEVCVLLLFVFFIL